MAEFITPTTTRLLTLASNKIVIRMQIVTQPKMMREKILKKNTHAAFVIFFLIVFSFAEDNFQTTAFAQDVSQNTQFETICITTQEIKFPYITPKTGWKLVDNTLEIPIGRAAEEIESVADMIVEKMPRLIAAALAESQAVNVLTGLVPQCGTDPYICKPHCDIISTQNHTCSAGCGPGQDPCDECVYGCSAPTPDCCCSGTISCEAHACTCNTSADGSITYCIPATLIACPTGSNDTSIITAQAVIITGVYNEIKEPFLRRFKPVTLYKTQYSNNQSLLFYTDILPAYASDPVFSTPVNSADSASKAFCADPSTTPWNAIYDPPQELEGVPSSMWPSQYLYCFSPIELEVNENLLKSRQRLFSCALRQGPTDIAGLGVEYSKLFQCKDLRSFEISVHSFLNLTDPTYYIFPNSRLTNTCFGNAYCLNNLGESYPGPCAEDFYCCY